MVNKNWGWQALPNGWRYGVIVLLVLGIFLRFYNLDRKVYWIDETNTSLRTLGYTKTEVIETAFTGEVITADQLMQFQRLSPDRGWSDTWTALTGTTEHTPLYFLLSRAWIGVVGHSVATMRALTAIFSVLAIPCLFWLCWELFQSFAVGWVAVGLYAVTPLHVLYAQEARPYSLWTVMILLSSALLLRSLRTSSRQTWILYGLSLMAGLYTQLLFGVMILTHGFYVLLIEKWRSPTTRAYLLTTAVALLAFTPWLALLIHNLPKVQESTRSLTEGYSFDYMVNRWFLNSSLAFFGRELGSANLLFGVLCGVAVGLLPRITPKRSWLFVVLLVAVPFLSLALPDVILGGRASLRIRYLFPTMLGIQLAFAAQIALQGLWGSTWRQQVWRGVLGLLVVGGLASCMISSQAVVWWNKSVPRSSYYPIVSALINEAANPLVISDGSVTDTLAFSRWLDPDVHLQLSLEPRKIRVAPGYDPIFLLNPEESTKRIFTRRGYELTLLYRDTTDADDVVDRLWRAEKSQ